MNERQVGDIAEAAFRARFGDVKVVCVNVRSGFDHEDDPVVDVNIIYDAKYERLKGGGLPEVRSEIIDKGVARDEGLPRLPACPLHPQVRDRATRPRNRVRWARAAWSMPGPELSGVRRT